ncbi:MULTISPECIES: hypothetical protein [Bacillaceae]|uniref:hypothetical protein n=1 Tax=Bacillaceae TaxID=186817 RepID=UPI001C597D98|nr:hypothetical protein [Rossellomorea sp. YZS02]MBW3113680.1 hypothetical protein [Bacillus sp. MCCB 382]MDX8343591.1 hypothetical protein [Rossellomorea sp. YZS02]
MSDWGILFLLVMMLVTILLFTNFLVVKVSGSSKKKRIWAGVTCFLLSPLIMLVTGLSVSPFDPYGFGTGMTMLIYGTFCALNGLRIIVVGLFME